MNPGFFLIAQSADVVESGGGGFASGAFVQILLFGLCVLLVAALAGSVCFVVIRKARRHRRRGHSSGVAEDETRPPRLEGLEDEDRAALRQPSSSRRRSRRNPYTRRNPTLAESGGLPPLRGENQPPPPGTGM